MERPRSNYYTIYNVLSGFANNKKVPLDVIMYLKENVDNYKKVFGENALAILENFITYVWVNICQRAVSKEGMLKDALESPGNFFFIYSNIPTKKKHYVMYLVGVIHYEVNFEMSQGFIETFCTKKGYGRNVFKDFATRYSDIRTWSLEAIPSAALFWHKIGFSFVGENEEEHEAFNQLARKFEVTFRTYFENKDVRNALEGEDEEVFRQLARKFKCTFRNYFGNKEVRSALNKMELRFVPEQEGGGKVEHLKMTYPPQNSLFIDLTAECKSCESKAIFKCGECQSVFYCSHSCQKEDWDDHSEECGDLKVVS